MKSGNVTLFQIAGIRITIHFSWLFIFLLIFWSLSAGYFPHSYPGQPGWIYLTAGLIATLLFFISVLLHELAHSLMAIRKGIHIPEITLFLFGGVSRLSEEARDAGAEFKIAIIGPLTSFALAAVFWFLAVGVYVATNFIMAVVIHQYLKYFYHGSPVQENGKTVGILNLEDIRDIPEDAMQVKTAKEVARPLEDNLQVSPETPLTDVLQKMDFQDTSRLVVMKNGRMTGFISKSALMRFMEIQNILAKDPRQRQLQP